MSAAWDAARMLYGCRWCDRPAAVHLNGTTGALTMTCAHEFAPRTPLEAVEAAHAAGMRAGREEATRFVQQRGVDTPNAVVGMALTGTAAALATLDAAPSPSTPPDPGIANGLAAVAEFLDELRKLRGRRIAPYVEAQVDRYAGLLASVRRLLATRPPAGVDLDRDTKSKKAGPAGPRG